MGPDLTGAPAGFNTVTAILKFLIILNRLLRSHFVLGPANYVMRPTQEGREKEVDKQG